MTRAAVANSENIFLRTDDFNNAYWTQYHITIGTDAIAGPFPGTFADSLIEDGTNNQHAVYNTAIALSAGRPWSMSVIAKAGTRSWISILGDNGTARAWFNLSTGAVGSIVTTGPYTPRSFIRPLGSGWYLCEVVGPYLAFPNGQNTIEAESADGTLGYLGTNGAIACYFYNVGLAYANWSGPIVVNAGSATTGPIRNLASRS